MTPQEKANELVDKYYPLFDNTMSLYLAKKCALIAVDELLKTRMFGVEFYYWDNVKLEIQKINEL